MVRRHGRMRKAGRRYAVVGRHWRTAAWRRSPCRRLQREGHGQAQRSGRRPAGGEAGRGGHAARQDVWLIVL